MFGINRRALGISWTVFLFVFFIFLLYEIRETILVFAAALFFAYMLSPIVGFVERFLPKRRTLALALVYVFLVGGMVGLGFALIPTLAGEATSLVTRLPSLIYAGKLSEIPLPHWLEPMRAQVMDALHHEADSLQRSVVPFIQSASTQILSGVSALIPMILVPILAFFFLKDARDIRMAMVELFHSEDRRGLMNSVLDEVHSMLQGYIKALIILSLVSFIVWAIFLSLLAEPYELLLSGLAAILEFIPVVGPAAALAIILVVCGVSGAGGLLWIIVFWGLYRLFQDYVLNPYLMSSGVEIHPLLVLFGVLAGEKIGGIPGMFFSVPALAILRVIYGHVVNASKHTRLTQV